MKTRERAVLIVGGHGYIGSALGPSLRRLGHRVDVVDLVQGDAGAFEGERRMDYRDLTAADLSAYDVIVHLAAHSNVKAATAEPMSAIDNNVTGFLGLLQRIGSQRLIYASSASVYSGQGAIPISEGETRFQVSNIYDLTKYTDDCLAALYGKDYYGLRFGTVNGHAPNTRFDLIINSMVRSAVEHGCITVSNADRHRSILGLRDLAGAVAAIIDSESRPGIYNLASFAATIGDIGREVARLLGVSIISSAGTSTYDFTMDTRKFSDSFSFVFRENTFTIVLSLLLNNPRWLSGHRLNPCMEIRGRAALGAEAA